MFGDSLAPWGSSARMFARAPDIKPMGDHPEAHDFDFWEGTWNQVMEEYQRGSR